ncbi:MAG TPA: hypothetical protein VF432_07985 [Thermoanaerobaculia bacterium]
MSTHRSIRLLVAGFLVSGIAGGVLLAEGARVQTAEEAIAADARWYAQSQGVSHAEAVRRLRIQSEMGGLIGQLRRTHRARLAGIVIEHQPVYRVRVRLTGTVPVAPQEHKLGGSRLPVVFETGAKATLAELTTAMSVHMDALRRIYPTLAGMGTDERTGEIVLDVYAPTASEADAARAKFAEAQALLGVPARLEIASAYPTTLVGTVAGSGRQ